VSNLVFPLSLAGGYVVSRAPVTTTAVQTTQSGKELRSTWSTYPRYKYAVHFDFLRSTSQTEFQQLFTFVARHAGSLDSFLFADPEDSSVTDCGFGVGDGATATFQLQRALTGYKPDSLGTWQNGTKPRTNILAHSQQFDAWECSTGVVTCNAVVAPDGSATGARYVSGGSDGWLRQVPTLAPSTTYVFSVWLKVPSGTRALNLYFIGPGSVPYQVTSCALTTTWQRFSVTGVTVVGGAGACQIGGANSLPVGAEVHLWGAQLEVGAVATQYIPTTTTALTSTPLYWPLMGAGFEPVFDPSGPLSLYVDGDWQGFRQLYQTARTNLQLRSADLSAWTKTGATVTVDTFAAPDGTTTADAIVEDASTGSHYVYMATSGTATVGQVYTCSVWVHGGVGTRPRMKVCLGCGAFGGDVGTVFDMTTGAAIAGDAAVIAHTATAFPGGWWRYSVTAAAVAANPLGVVLFDADASSQTAGLVGTNNTVAYVWGAQVETGTVATGYIPTAATAVTVTDFTLGSQGSVTLTTPPAAGSFLSWSGSYFRRVRFAADEIGADRIVQQLWKTGAIGLISVKP